MNRTITVKGAGDVTVRPDRIVLRMKVESKRRKYEKAMELAADKGEALAEAVEKAGIDRSELKTADFCVNSDYQHVRQPDGTMKSVFDGFLCVQSFKLELDLDFETLGAVLSNVCTCSAEPELSLRFTVKEPNAVSEALLRSAAQNAKEKARILCEASGKKLGELVSISYNWGELNIFSHTDLDMSCMRTIPAGTASFKAMHFEPDDISVSDTAVFVWEME